MFTQGRGEIEMKKIILSAVLDLISMVAYAGVAWINYDTGDFKCTSGYVGNLHTCTASGIRTYGVELCRSQASDICGS